MRARRALLTLPVLVSLMWVEAADAISDDRLAELERLAWARDWSEIEQRMRDLESRLDEATERQRARFLLLRARMAAIASDTEEAVERLRELLDRRSELDPDLRLRALNLSANALVIDGQFERGFDDFRRALELAPVVDATRVRADTYNVAADFHARIGEYSTALEYANEAMEEQSPDTAYGVRTHCIALERRGRAQRGLGRLEQALEDYRNSLDACRRVPDLLFTGMAWVGIGRSLRALGDADAAENALRASLPPLAESGFSNGELEARTVLAGLLLERDRVSEAEAVLAPTWPTIREPGDHALRSDALAMHARVAERIGETSRAFEHAREAARLRQLANQRMRQMRLTLLMSDLDDEARERELELLRSQHSLTELNRENERQAELAVTYASGGAVAAGLLLFVLLVKTARDRRQFRNLSQRDGLTGLLNHTHFFDRAQQAFTRARQNATPFSLIIADIDLFKRVNDEHGHLVGDAVLARIGERLRETFDDDAILGRLGGEEFGIALPGCDVDTAVARIEHLRAVLHRTRDDEREPRVTMSFGVAEMAREPSLDVLYAHADQALYDAKDAGRNRVITVARLDLGAAGFLT